MGWRRLPNQRRKVLTISLVAAIIFGGLGAMSAAHAQGSVNLYTSKSPSQIQPLLQAFSAATEISVNTVFAQSGLVETLITQGDRSKVDLLLVGNAVSLLEVTEAGLTSPLSSKTLSKHIPKHYRHPDGLWFLLSSQPQVIFAASARLGEEPVLSYADLAAPRFKGRVCSKPGDAPDQIALLAHLLAEQGEPAAKKWLRGIKKSLAQAPAGDDRHLIKAISDDVCDVAIGGASALEIMAQKPEQKAWAEAASVVYPDQNGTGTLMIFTGMALLKAGSNQDSAIRLMEFLVSANAQSILADHLLERPVGQSDVTETETPSPDRTGPKTTRPAQVKTGPFDADALIAHIHQARALVEAIQFNAGPDT